MAKNYTALAKTILKGVGCSENINNVTHCTTRLRFKLKDVSKANDDDLKNTDGVVTVVKAAGQYQVVIGNEVADVYEAVLKEGHLPGGGEVADDDGEEDDTSFMNKAIALISGIFTDILGPLSAGGIIKGLVVMFAAFGWLSTKSGTYQILYSIGDSIFYFLPVFLGVTTARRFRMNQFIGLAIGAVLTYPNIVALASSKTVLGTLFKGTAFASEIHTTFLGIPVVTMSYTSTVLPVIAAVWFGSVIEHWANRWVPTVIKTFIVPVITMVITLPVTLIVIGPITTWVGDAIGAVMAAVYGFSPIVAGILMGAVWQILVIFGVHWGIVAVTTADLASLGYDPILGLTCMVCYAQIGVVLAIIRQTKDPSLKKNAIGAFFSGLFGVTEPSIYGVTLPRKVPFVLSCIAGAVSGGVIGAFGSRLYMLPSMGVFAIPAYVNPDGMVVIQVVGVIVAAVIAFIVGFVLQILFGKKYVDQEFNEKQAQKEAILADGGAVQGATVVSPLDGTVIPLAEVDDEVFSSGAMGQGVAIEPTNGLLCAPVDGQVVMTFATGHAIGLKSSQGAELLIHIGMDTVNLQGKGFETLVQKGQTVSAGDLLVKFDLAAIKEAGYTVTTPIVITNSKDFGKVSQVATGEVKTGDKLLDLQPQAVDQLTQDLVANPQLNAN